MSATPIADAIRAIEDRIGDERWWTQWTDKRVAGARAPAFCLVGAASDVRRSGTADAIDLLEWMTQMLRDYTGDYIRFTTQFNDAPDTGHADVMLFLATCLDVAIEEGL